jgi:hypothetical protein
MKNYLYLMLVLLLFSCEKEVTIDIPGHEEKIVIDGRIETGQPPFILISRSKDIYSSTDLNSFLNGFISGAIVTVSDGTNIIQLDEICTDNLPPGTEEFAAQIFGVPAEEIANYHLCAYTSFNPVILGQVGKTYSLNVQFEGKTYTSNTQIVEPTALDSVYWQAAQGLSDYGYSYAKLSDPINSNDSYMWEIKRIDKLPDGTSIDKSFTKTFAPVFNDEFFNGSTFDFWYENPKAFDENNVEEQFQAYYKLGDTVVIKFSKMDNQTFEFFEKKYVQMSSGGSPFASPSNIPTNIIGGALGIWAGFSPSFDTLICKP